MPGGRTMDLDEQDGAGGREALPPGDEFGCPIRDQDSFEMII